MKNCPQCKGTGFIPKYFHIDNGKCFNCNGTGQIKQTGNSKRLEELQEKFIIVESKYLAAKKEIEEASNNFISGLITPFELSDICGKYNLNQQEKEYRSWIKSIEDEKKLLENI
jgi:RecJ-like exonuclease